MPNSVSAYSASRSFSVVAVPVITSASLPAGALSTAYSYQVTSSPAATTYFATGLPPGLAISTGGLITGTPTALGDYPVTLHGSNATGVGPNVTLSLVVGNVVPTITSTSPLPAGNVGVAYSQTLTKTGSGTITWTLVSGTLPPGFSFDPSTGTLFGTPTTAGTYGSLVIRASNSAGNSATVTFSITIGSAAPVVTTASLATGTVGSSYSQTLTASGAGTITWAQTGLPAGLVLNSSTGAITGTPTGAGIASVTVTPTSSTQGAGQPVTFNLTINAVASSAPGAWAPFIAERR